MTEHDLKCFAKYSFDQESRGIQHNSNERTNHISKFGVGAKEAGFFLGDRLRVITRVAGGCLLELSMDEKEYAARFERNENVYSGQIHREKDVQQLMRSGLVSADELRVGELAEVVDRCAQASPQFTAIVIRLRPDVASKFDQRYELIFSELSWIHHFYLHPEHSPNVILNDPKFQKPHMYSTICCFLCFLGCA